MNDHPFRMAHTAVSQICASFSRQQRKTAHYQFTNGGYIFIMTGALSVPASPNTSPCKQYFMINENNLSRRKLMQLLTATMIGSAFTSKLYAGSTLVQGFDESPGEIKPVFIAPGAGKKGKISEGDITFKLDKSQTAGNLGSSEMVLYPGFLGAPPHYHKNFDEICIVQEGTLHISVGNEVNEVHAGGWHLRPRGVVHTFWNSGAVPARFIDLYSPGGHEAYMQDLAKLFEGDQKPKPGDLEKLANIHDITFAFDKLPAIMEKYKVHL